MSGELQQFRMLIGGKAVGAVSGATFESHNPYTGRPWALVPDGGPADVDAAVAAARASFLLIRAIAYSHAADVPYPSAQCASAASNRDSTEDRAAVNFAPISPSDVSTGPDPLASTSSAARALR